MNDSDLVSIIQAHRKDSLGVEDGELSSERAEAMNHYHGRPYGNEVTGRSQIVSRDLMETVDWALPAVIRPFVQSGELAMFDPVGPEDEQLAEQESDYTNHAIMRDNPGFLIVHDLAKEAMLLKNCYVKHFWDESYKTEDTPYTGLTMDQVVKMISDLQEQDAEVEVLESQVTEVQIPGMPMPQNEAMAIMVPPTVEMVDMKLRVKKKCGKLVVYAVPSEEVRVSKKCRGSLQDSPFVEHVTKKTRTELIEMGMPRDFVYDLPAYKEYENSTEREARDSVDNETTDTLGSTFEDRSMDEVEYCEAYIRVDFDGDGLAELRKVVTCANRVPPGDQWNETIPAVPMTGGVIKRMPHRHVGESFDDEMADLQEIQTALKRQLNDNIYGINNNQWVVNERVNLPDFLTSLPGGVKRVRGDGAVGDSVMPVLMQPIVDKLLPVIDFYNKEKEVRVGVRPGSDMDPDMLQEVTKGAFLEHLNRASQKIEMITRLFGETVIKEMVQQCHGILQRHQNQERLVKLRGKWVPVNPANWKERTDLTVRVGLGTGNEEEKVRKTMLLSQLQGQLLQAAVNAPPAVYAKMYALFEDVSKAMNFELPEKYAVAPGSEEYQQLQQNKPPPPEAMKIQAEGQLEQMRMQMQQATDRHRQEMEAQEARARMQMDMALERMKAANDMQLEQFKATLKAQVDTQIAQMNNAAKLDQAQIAAQTTLTTQQEAASDQAAQD